MSDPVVEKKEAVSPEAAKETTPEPEKKKREYKDFGEEDDKPTRTFSLSSFAFFDLRSIAFPQKTPRLTCLR